LARTDHDRNDLDEVSSASGCFPDPDSLWDISISIGTASYMNRLSSKTLTFQQTVSSPPTQPSDIMSAVQFLRAKAQAATSAGSVGSVQTSAGRKGVAASGACGNNAAAGQTANGNKYATANGNVYKNTGSGWNQTQGTSHNSSSYSGSNSASARGYGGQEKSSGTSAFGGGGSGWQSIDAKSPATTR
jgi:hypothetical protein